MPTVRPRTDAGEISAIYMGLNMEAIPTPIPAAKRMAIKTVSEPDRAIPIDDKANTIAAVITPSLRPKGSAHAPAISQPAIQPNASEPVRKPSHQAVKPKVVRKKGNAPEITAKSNPNKYPPSAEINEMAII